MIDVFRVEGIKEMLPKMNSEERSTFLLLGYSSNQVAVLWKLITIATNRTSAHPIEQRLEGAQTQILVRLLIGVLRETWRMVERQLLGSKLGREYVPLFDQEAASALKRLKVRFGSSNPVTAVRNEYAFHYPKAEDLEAAFAAAVASGDMEEADWGVYFSHKLLNSYFFVSDYVFAHGLSRATGEADFISGYQRLLMSLAPIANDLSELAFGFTAAVLKKYVGQEVTMTVIARIENAPNIDDLTLPFFTEPTRETSAPPELPAMPAPAER